MPRASRVKPSGDLVAAAPKKALYEINGAMIPLVPGKCLVLKERKRVDLRLLPFNPDNDDSDSDPDEPVTRSSRRLAEKAISDPALHDWAYSYVRLVAPAIEGGAGASSSGGMLLADGAVVVKYLRCPGEVNGARMRERVRYPELIAVDTHVLVWANKFHSVLCGIIDLAIYGELVMKIRDGRPVPCHPPVDNNDLTCRYHVPTAQDDVPVAREMMCMADMCTLGQVWNTMITGQIRYCIPCAKFFHAGCLEEHGSQVTVADMKDHLDDWNQGHLHHVLRPDRPAERPPAPYIGFGVDADVDKDIDDTASALAWYETTWAELACFPIRRRTNPGEAPQTLETVILHAIKMVKDGRGEEIVPDPAQWVRDPEVGGPQAGIRATKYLVAKDLRKLRGEDRFRRFTCIGCMTQII
ncbi:uncharacterized protein SCHCODRAFT_01243053 [Schizophyllum commune H4-8]|nr:uncharacterized protein SCHCODRAFT_01243053 [Schizophyllum commune H4-8]KAI5886772.1 hypothetical protein SCHCODRAFT_01243053 [Schizophyllum commune H4-8]